jgi:hypothetical protein
MTIQQDTAAAAVLELSDALDVSLHLRLAAWREGYDCGYELGVEDGRRQVLAEETAARRAMAARVAGARPGSRYVSADELDRRRYPPDGRASWLLPASGDAA